MRQKYQENRFKKKIYIYIYIGAISRRSWVQILACHIFNLFRCVLSFSASLAKCWKVQFRLGLAINSTTLILITAYQHPKILYYIYIYICIIYIYIYDLYKVYIYIYIYI